MLPDRGLGFGPLAAALAGEGPAPRLPCLPVVDNYGAGDDIVQRAAITPEQDAKEAQPQQEEAERKRQRSHQPTLGTHTAAVLADDLHTENHHAERLTGPRPAVGEVKELPGEEGEHHPLIGPAPVDGGSG
jgi:hypothetical protein